MNLQNDSFTPSLPSAPYRRHVYLFILAGGSEVQITGVIALVIVQQLADLEMMDTEVCILQL